MFTSLYLIDELFGDFPCILRMHTYNLARRTNGGAILRIALKTMSAPRRGHRRRRGTVRHGAAVQGDGVARC